MQNYNAITNVPSPELTDAGFVAPIEQDILTGLQRDLNTALGGNANPALNTPQGQIAMSMTAVLGDWLSCLLQVFNGVDPARASGTMQDAIGRIYFMERRAATPTSVTVQLTLRGDSLSLIPAKTPIATDNTQNGNLYGPAEDLSFPSGTVSPVTTTLVCLSDGAVDCPANSLLLYQGSLGIAALSNADPGTPGAPAESRAAFEARRAASIERNSVGQNASLLGALFTLPDVSDAYVIDNPTNDTVEQQGVSIPPHCLYTVVSGGEAQDIGRAILTHKSPGCGTAGSQNVRVQETNEAYNGNGPSYNYHYDRARNIPLYVHVVLASTSGVPSNMEDLLADALMAWLISPDTRPRLGATLYASRLSCAVHGLGNWADVLSLSIGTAPNPTATRLTLPVNQLITAVRENITIELE